LAKNNLYLHPFSNLLLYNQNSSFLRVQHIQTNIETPPVNSLEIILPNYDFSNEVHNENFYYTRLIA
ncbi:30137_t:CDS:1, partial [Gigaspora margarita]